MRLVKRREALEKDAIRLNLAGKEKEINDNLLEYASQLYMKGFAKDDIEWAQRFSHMSSQQITEEGVELEAMGLTFENQPLDSASRTIDTGEEGIITQKNRASRRLWLGLKYWNGEPVLRKARMISKPTKRIWLDRQRLGYIVRGKQAGEVKGLTQIGEVMAISTDRGIMDVRECVERQIGGQPLARFW